MKTKYFIFAALAGMTFAGCSSDDFIAETPPVNNVDEGMVPILFTSQKSNFTRADFKGAEAAELLNNQFVVSGYKGASTTWNDATSSIVFDNYAVQYTANTANTTESNSSNWEYVGVTPILHATNNGISSQTIKYWDYSKTQYDFMAWGIGKKLVGTTPTAITPIYTGTPTLGKVLVSAITYKTATGASGTAYTFQGKSEDLAHCYISDLVTVKKTGTEGIRTKIGYGNPVTLRFRQLGTKVRFAIYETVPGYSVKNVSFYTVATSTTDTDAGQVSPTLFTTKPGDIFTQGTYTVYFPTVNQPENDDNNQAHITFAPSTETGVTQSTLVQWTNGLNYTYREQGEKDPDAVYLGRTSNTASFAGDADVNYYTFYLPNESGTNLNLRVNYTLESIDGSGETILVQGATAQVPSIYTKWQPGYAYTYLFKISDKTNGHTGVYDPTRPDDTTINSDPAGLYPITFDAVVENAEDGDRVQETITLVSTPSITTYQSGSNVVNNNEYTVLTPNAVKGISGKIYVTVNDGTADTSSDPQVSKLENGALQDLTDKAELYVLPDLPTGRTAPWSEAEVIDALTYVDDDGTADDGATIKGRSGLVLTKTTGDAALTLGNVVQYGVDVNEITIEATGTEKKAASFTPAASTNYAFVYTKKAAATANNEVRFEPQAFSDFATGQTKYRYDYKEAKVVNDKGTAETTDDETSYDAQKGHVYFSRSGSGTTESPYAYTKVAAPFIGQGVGNLFTDAACTQAASGYAVTGTPYYYTLDGGITPKTAHPVNYADFGNTLYVWDPSANSGAGDYVANTDAAPVDGKAYYYKEANDTYTYCVILPQQTNQWYELDTEAAKVEANETAEVDGQTYFDKYTKNDGEYYVKVIKVQ